MLSLSLILQRTYSFTSSKRILLVTNLFLSTINRTANRLASLSSSNIICETQYYSIANKRKFSSSTITLDSDIRSGQTNQHHNQHNYCQGSSRYYPPLVNTFNASATLNSLSNFIRNNNQQARIMSSNHNKILNNNNHIHKNGNCVNNNKIYNENHHINDECINNSNGVPSSNGHNDSNLTNGDSCSNNSRHNNQSYTLDQIREQLRKCDPNCNGHLELTLNDQTGIGILCINSPQRKNAFSGFMMAQFSDILDQLEQWTKGQVIILYGADNFFCSGADLKTIRQNNLSDQCGAYFISELMHSNLTRLERLPLVSVALIEGKALGGGAEIITACDFRVAAADAQIGFVHAKLGVTPGFGGGTRLVRLVGPTRALQLMLSAKLIDAGTAEHLGLVQHVLGKGIIGDDALKATVEWYRSNYGAITPFASRAIKSIVATGLGNLPTTQVLETEAKIFCSVWGKEEHKKALASNIKHYK